MAIEEDPGVEGAPEWITTFVDMISLLVTFFILLFTFSSIEEYETFTFPENILGTRGIIESDGGSAAVDPPEHDLMAAIDIARGATVPHSRPSEELSENLEEMGQKLTDSHIKFDPKRVKDGLVIRFGDTASFRPGSVEVNAVLRKALGELARTMQHYPHLLVVEGFTDSEFKASRDYKTPEALACARASAAAQVMLAESELSPKLLQIAGLGMQRPLNGNNSPTQRTANRRVEIRIVAMDEARANAVDREGR
jgi:chemotaxis protein MotB